MYDWELYDWNVYMSDNPLLMSKATMKNAEMKLDFVNDEADIFGKGVNLEIASSRHQSIMPTEETLSLKNCLFTGCKTVKKIKYNKTT